MRKGKVRGTRSDAIFAARGLQPLVRAANIVFPEFEFPRAERIVSDAYIRKRAIRERIPQRVRIREVSRHLRSSRRDHYFRSSSSLASCTFVLSRSNRSGIWKRAFRPRKEVALPPAVALFRESSGPPVIRRRARFLPLDDSPILIS